MLTQTDLVLNPSKMNASVKRCSRICEITLSECRTCAQWSDRRPCSGVTLSSIRRVNQWALAAFLQGRSRRQGCAVARQPQLPHRLQLGQTANFKVPCIGSEVLWQRAISLCIRASSRKWHEEQPHRGANSPLCGKAYNPSLQPSLPYPLALITSAPTLIAHRTLLGSAQLLHRGLWQPWVQTTRSSE